ncbi:MAG TPA: ABC transporter ATP-binding protein [Burkholderiaceae bacterium]|nr:ABC transporter ATP-binding protein [Burkholderiaceae bacterium]
MTDDTRKGETDCCPTLGTRELALGYGERKVINGLTVEIPPGKVTAIVGPNGCGKSTLLAGLARILAPRSGAVLLDGRDINTLATREVAHKLALLPQDASAPDGLTVEELIQFGRQPYRSLMRQWSPKDAEIVQAALHATQLQALADRPLDALSGGQRQRAWIAMTVAQDTPLLLLDEPTSALDLGHQIEVLELVRELSRKGKTVVMVIHDLPSACRYADHLIAMHQGEIIAEGRPADIVTEALVERLYGVRCTLLHEPGTGAPLIVNPVSIRHTPE